MSARIEAAVKAWDHHWGDRYGDEALEEMGEEVQVALAAADEVMFSDEAIERAARAAWEYDAFSDPRPELQQDYIQMTKIMVAALKGDA